MIVISLRPPEKHDLVGAVSSSFDLRWTVELLSMLLRIPTSLRFPETPRASLKIVNNKKDNNITSMNCVILKEIMFPQVISFVF